MRQELKEYEQEHLLRHLDELSEDEQATLYADITDTDWSKVARLWKTAKREMTENGEMKDERLKPLDSSIVGSTARDKDLVARWYEKGMDMQHVPTTRNVNKPSPYQAWRKSHRDRLRCCCLQEVRVQGWVSPTPRACTMWGCPQAKHCTSCKRRGS